MKILQVLVLEEAPELALQFTLCAVLVSPLFQLRLSVIAVPVTVHHTGTGETSLAMDLTWTQLVEWAGNDPWILTCALYGKGGQSRHQQERRSASEIQPSVNTALFSCLLEPSKWYFIARPRDALKHRLLKSSLAPSDMRSNFPFKFPGFSIPRTVLCMHFFQLQPWQGPDFDTTSFTFQRLVKGAVVILLQELRVLWLMARL